MMSPLSMSLLSWLGGGVAGSLLSPNHRIAGFALGALTVGVIADKIIEDHHPGYNPGGPALTDEEIELRRLGV